MASTEQLLPPLLEDEAVPPSLVASAAPAELTVLAAGFGKLMLEGKRVSGVQRRSSNFMQEEVLTSRSRRPMNTDSISAKTKFVTLLHGLLRVFIRCLWPVL